jgi:hypothetical protein
MMATREILLAFGVGSGFGTCVLAVEGSVSGLGGNGVNENVLIYEDDLVAREVWLL